MTDYDEADGISGVCDFRRVSLMFQGRRQAQ